MAFALGADIMPNPALAVLPSHCIEPALRNYDGQHVFGINGAIKANSGRPKCALLLDLVGA